MLECSLLLIMVIFMWYPNVSKQVWLRLHPQLEAELPIKCICGKVAKSIKPYVTELCAGFTSDQCSCGAPYSTVGVLRSKKLSKEISKLIG